MSKKRDLILVVDDTEESVELLVEILGDRYEVCVATDGLSTLETAANQQPDIILLDILMPDMDGYEVCRRLKQAKNTRDIPIIFITALTDVGDETRGLALGAVDYITKPFEASIVLARIKTHLALKQLSDDLKNSISILTHDKEILQHKAELGIQAGGLAHDIANIIYAGQLVSLIPDLIPDDLDNRSKIIEIVEMVMESTRLGTEICHGFRSYIKGMEDVICEQDPAELLAPLSMYARQYNGELIKEIEDNLPAFRCKPGQIKRVLVNLFINAMQELEGKKDPRIHIRVFSDRSCVCFSVTDNGEGIPEHLHSRIFEERFTTKPQGTGLGLFMLRQIVDAHNGTVTVDSRETEGATFTIALPALSESPL